MGQSRRSFLLGFGIAATGGVVYHYRDAAPDELDTYADAIAASIDNASVHNRSQNGSGDGGNPTTNFGIGSGAFKSGEWTEDGYLVVTIGAKHEFTEIGLWHALDERGQRGDPSLWATTEFDVDVSVPKYEGTITVPVLDAVSDSGADFPSRKFKLMGFTPFGSTLATAGFRIPDQFESATLPD